MAKTCTKPKVEVVENKALFSAWGMDDDEPDLCEDFKGTCLMAHEETLPQEQTSSKDRWYIDSGCSCHMTDFKDILSSFQTTKGGAISFGD